jgi:integrase
MSADLATRVERYLEERRRLGFDLRCPAYCLRSLARHVRHCGHRGPLTMEVMAEWARQTNRSRVDSRTWARRLKSLRPFTRWLQQFEPSTEVPDSTIFGRPSGRLAPHIYTEREITDLLAAARRLEPEPGLHSKVFETLFALIACTGMRVSEAMGLRNSDVDLQHGLLTIRRTKFAKSRHVPIHLSAVSALGQYRWTRDLAGASQAEEAPFFVDARARRYGDPLDRRHVERVFESLREELRWINRGTHHAPRIHDLRHTFVVRRILLWQQQGVDVDQAMLALSTYVGHAKVTNTYWYLQAVPELMAIAAQRFEAYMPEVTDV